MPDWQLKDGKDTGHGTQDLQAVEQENPADSWSECDEDITLSPLAFHIFTFKKIRIILAECCFASKNIPDVDAENIYVLKLNTVQIKYDFQTDFRPFV